MNRIACFLTPLVTFAAMGCSSPTPSSSDQNVTVEKACADEAAAACDSFSRCAPLVVTLSFGDLAKCKERALLGCASRFTATGTSETTAKAERCVAAVASATCANLLSATAPSGCETLPGKLIDGTACGDNAQCASTFCAKKAGAGCGTCAPANVEGGPCESDDACGRGLKCAPTKKCTKSALIAASCDPMSAPCAAGLSCYGGKCVAGAKSGDKCDPLEKTAPNCDLLQGLICSTTCKPLVFANAGEACGQVGMDFKLCRGGGDCKDGKCVAPAVDGGKCDDAMGPGCLSPATCVNGACKLPDAGSCK
ncbi:MAG: hypothetical protein NVSMB1_16390 [Polyangiales bacterium]